MRVERRVVGTALDLVWLLGLALYVIGGYRAVPLHGDESTLITMSRDYAVLVQQRQVDPLLYRDPPRDPAAQELRILNGTIPKMTIGLAWDLAGYSAADLNEPWVWEWSWDQNLALGHLPTERLLRTARLPSTLFTALSVVPVFLIARRAAGGRRLAAWAASLIYATAPAVLLNGRRAMMEGSTLFFTLGLIWLALWLLDAQGSAGRRARWAGFAALGVLAGLAVASKHTAGITVAAAFAALALGPWVRRERRGAFWPGVIGGLAAAGAIALGVFLALNPAWWSEPLRMPGHVLEARTRLLDIQSEGAKTWGGYYWKSSDRVTGLLNEMFFAAPQYYEVPVWQEYVGGQIRAYERSGWAGRRGGAIWGGLLVAAFAFGTAELIARWRVGAAWGVLAWLAITLLALLAVNPFEWQRYYLPVQGPVAVIAGIGVGRIAAFAAEWMRAARSRTS